MKHDHHWRPILKHDFAETAAVRYWRRQRNRWAAASVVLAVALLMMLVW